MRVTWLTDLHLNFVEPPALAAFVARVAADAPDAILVSGDTGEAHDVVGFWDQLAAIAPVHAVLGNHDFYRSTIADVRRRAAATSWWLPARGPVALTPTTTLIGVDGWGDARCGNLESSIKLADWRWIGELDGLLWCDAAHRCATLQALGDAEAATLRAQLADLGACRELVVLTHVPPFADACWYDGKPSGPDWLPWFTCLAVGDVLAELARARPELSITVLCGHTHGRGEHRVAPNLLVKTGGWPPGEPTYGHPAIQASWALT